MNIIPHVIGIDGSHLAHRNYRVAQEITKDKVFYLPKESPEDPDEIDHEAIHKNLINTSLYLILNSLFSIMTPKSKTVIFFDYPGSTSYRKSINPKYKSNRTPNNNVYEILNKLSEFLDKLSIHRIGIEGLEADDLGYWTSRFVVNSITYVSEDHDWDNYVRDNKVLLRPITNVIIDNNKILKRCSKVLDMLHKDDPSVVPTNELLAKILLHRKALMGDGSDCVSKFKGIGPKSVDVLVYKILKDGKNFTPKGVAEKRVKEGYFRFEDNMKVLGYAHIDVIDIRSFLAESVTNTITRAELAASLTEIFTEINSKSLLTRLDKVILKLLDSDGNRSGGRLVDLLSFTGLSDHEEIQKSSTD